MQLIHTCSGKAAHVVVHEGGRLIVRAALRSSTMDVIVEGVVHHACALKLAARLAEDGRTSYGEQVAALRCPCERDVVIRLEVDGSSVPVRHAAAEQPRSIGTSAALAGTG